MKTTASWWLNSTVSVFQTMKLPVEDLFLQAGIDFEQLSNLDARFPQDGITQLWQLAEKSCNDQTLGLKVGQQLHPRSFNVLGYAVLSSRTLREGLKRFLRYQHVIGESADIQIHEFTEDGIEKISIEFQFEGDELPVSIHTIDMAMSSCVSMARWIISEKALIEGATLARPRPIQIDAFIDVYGVNVKFNQPSNSIIISKILFDVEIPFSNEEIANQNEALFQQHLIKQPGKLTLTDRVIKLIIPRLSDGIPSKEYIAKQLNMSSKTLQRRLKEEGLNYQDILNQLRQKLAKELISKNEISVHEIAYLLGFSEASNFHRAFKRWFNMTPKEYRNQRNR